MNSTYVVDFAEMIQYRRDDRDRQRPIRRLDDTGSPAYVFDDLPDVPAAVKKKAKLSGKFHLGLLKNRYLQR